VGVQLDADDGAVLVAHGSHTTVRKQFSFSEEQLLTCHSWSGVEVSLKRTPIKEGQWYRALLVPFAEPQDDGSAALAQQQVSHFEVYKIGNSAAGVEQHLEDRCRSDVLTQFDFPQQPTNLTAVESLWGQSHSLQFLHFLGAVVGDLAMVS
jgi:hypothetical protein